MLLVVAPYCLLLEIAFSESTRYIYRNRFLCCRSLPIYVRQVNRVGNYYNPIGLSDDESVGCYESRSDSYTSLEIIMHFELKVGIPISNI